ncbi:alpha/beta fold hydrolase [Sulfitobacter donghicola]|uniref:Alpha/beta hydrolase n=1 Tax=Sulfitobacter donghicola DSW-25 = KCTC 12864 = JCM 14565 TaxID=1300350 RepID=A0A073IG87_9RHOB|nr:alpha/beta hydrolase [Sulfitobacter donghicola]KEJ88819.1 alpha/beta hydrolase [Sulfitobacter donghicola DSW-25 = KCTC 12864 = JCM 14565]KIN68614.1 Hydrolase, alpha/beta fold family [Sulfitobacter donghicola DSW-25 = KCTC 12864 = JCM 14565]
MTLGVHTHLFEGADRRGLAIHCTLGQSGAWRGVAAALKDDISLLAFDLPSHGKSEEWDRSGDIHDVSTDMARGLITEPMDLIGHSFGATIALRIAVETPELVRSLTMIEPVYFAAVLADHPELLEQFEEDSAAMNAAFDAGDEREAARIFNRDWGDGTPWDKFPKRMQDHMTRLIHFVPESYAFLHLDSGGLLDPGRMEGATMPSLLIEGDQSPKMSGQIATSLEARLPNVTRAVVKGAGHMLPVTHPEEVAKPIRALLARS